MDDYMERRRVLSILHEIGGCGAEPGTWADGYDKAINEAYDRISREPTADVVPVVRCKDCENAQNECDGMIICRVYKHIMWLHDFCSYGKRKGGGV